MNGQHPRSERTGNIVRLDTPPESRTPPEQVARLRAEWERLHSGPAPSAPPPPPGPVSPDPSRWPRIVREEPDVSFDPLWLRSDWRTTLATAAGALAVIVILLALAVAENTLRAR